MIKKTTAKTSTNIQKPLPDDALFFQWLEHPTKIPLDTATLFQSSFTEHGSQEKAVN